MKILVAGGTSNMGRVLVRELRARGHSVRALVRDRARAPDGVAAHPGDLTRPETLRGACDDIDVVVSAAGAPVDPRWRFPETTFEAVDVAGNLALLAEAERAGVRRFVYVSVFGDYPPGLGYVDAHLRVEAALRASSLRATIVRPTGFHSAQAMILALARWRIGGVIGSGSGRSNPIADADLAVVLAEAVTGDVDEIDAGGPDILDRHEIAALAFAVAGTRGLTIRVPAGWVRLQAALLRPFNPRLADLLAFFAHVMTHDEIAPVRGHTTLEASFRAE